MLKPLYEALGGKFEPLEKIKDGLSVKAKSLIEWAFKDVTSVVDHHSHLGGLGHGGSGCSIHPQMTAWWNIVGKIKFSIFLQSAGVSDNSGNVDREFLIRLSNLVKILQKDLNLPWEKQFILAMDSWYDVNGEKRIDKTGLYTPNDWVLGAASEFPEIFEAVCSIHPYREDAEKELRRVASLGCRVIKWLPNSMGMDLRHAKCVKFYEIMKELNMVLLCHVGEEHSVDQGGPDQALGNPLLLRAPLDVGIKVIAAHCASEGYNRDLDDPKLQYKLNFDLFYRLMKEKKYEGLLFADISAMTAFRRLGKPLTTMLDSEFHSRLVFGTDYPVPAINLVVQTSALVRHGYIKEHQRELLNEIYRINPLLFDFVTKRCLVSPKTGKAFALSVFGWNNTLLPPKSVSNSNVMSVSPIIPSEEKYEVKQENKEVEEIKQEETQTT